MKAIERIAPDVGWQPISFVNAYLVGHSGGPWALIDSGLPGRAERFSTRPKRASAPVRGRRRFI